jgi:hypothetical protein
VLRVERELTEGNLDLLLLSWAVVAEVVFLLKGRRTARTERQLEPLVKNDEQQEELTISWTI